MYLKIQNSSVKEYRGFFNELSSAPPAEIIEGDTFYAMDTQTWYKWNGSSWKRDLQTTKFAFEDLASKHFDEPRFKVASEEDLASMISSYFEKNGNNLNFGFNEFCDNMVLDYEYDEDTNANYTVMRIYKDKANGTKQFAFVRSPGRMSALDLSKKENWFIIINSGLGVNASQPIDGVVVENGVVINNSPANHHTGSMPLTIDAEGNLGYAEADVTGEQLVQQGIMFAVCGFCPIIVNYQPVTPPTVGNVSHFTQNAQRQIIGQFGNGDYAIITCEGRNFDHSDGWTIAEAQSICQKYGLKFAYNLDGGGSTETVLGRKQLNTIYEGKSGRLVPTFIVFNGKDSFAKVSEGEAVENNTDDPSSTSPSAPSSPTTPSPSSDVALPDGYTRLQYVETDGSQYIQTSLKRSQISSADYDVLLTGTSTNGGHILSTRKFYLPFIKPIDQTTSQLNYLLCNYDGSEPVNSGIGAFDYNIRYHLSFDEGNVKACIYNNDGTTSEIVSYVLAKGETTSNRDNKMALFTYGDNLENKVYRFKGRLYSFDAADDNGELTANYIPCINDNGVVGIYDTVSKTFMSSNTDSPLIAGPAI